MVADGHMLCGLMLQKMIELLVNALGIGIAADNIHHIVTGIPALMQFVGISQYPD